MKNPVFITSTQQSTTLNKLAEAEYLWAQLRSIVNSIRVTEINTNQYYLYLNRMTELSTSVLDKMHQAVGLLAQSSANKVRWMVKVEWIVLGIAILLSVIYGLLVGRMITVPITQLTHAADRITKGEKTDLPSTDCPNELGILTRAFQTMVSHLNVSQKNLENLTDTLEKQVEQRTASLDKEIAERKETEETLRDSQAKLQAIFDGIPDGIIFANRERCILSVNRGVHKTFGYKIDELIGQKTSMLFGSEEEYQRQDNIQRNLSPDERLKPYEARYRYKNGGSFLGETVAKTIQDINGDVIGFIGVVRDITTKSFGGASQALAKNGCCGTAHRRYRA